MGSHTATTLAFAGLFATACAKPEPLRDSPLPPEQPNDLPAVEVRTAERSEATRDHRDAGGAPETTTGARPEVAATTACAGPLPAKMPGDLVVGRSVIELPRGKGPRRYGGELTTDPRRCEHPTCIAVPHAELRDLWVLFLQHDFPTMTRRAERRSPHVGSRRLWLRFGDTRCELSDDSRHEVERSDAFHELVRATAALGQAHAPTTPPP